MRVSFLQTIKNRIRNNENCIIILTGETGSGKSWSALAIAQILDKNFSMDNVVIGDDEKRYLTLIREKQKGSVILWDEIGVGHNAKDFMTAINKAIEKVNQTIRFRNQIIIFTLPSQYSLDLGTKRLAHYLIHTHHKDKKNRCVIAKVYRIRLSAFDPKPHYSKPQRNEYSVYAEIEIPAPTDDIIAEYEKVRRIDMDKFHDNPYRKKEKIRSWEVYAPLTDFARRFQPVSRGKYLLD